MARGIQPGPRPYRRFGQMKQQVGSHEVAQPDGSDDADREISCSMTSVLLRLVRSELGEKAVSELLDRACVPHREAYLESVDNWVSLEQACAMLQAGVDLTGDPSFARRVGENALRQHAGTAVATVLRSLGSTEAVLKAVAVSSSRLSTVTTMETVEIRPGHAVIRAAVRPGFTRRPLHCDWARGLLAATPMLFGLPLARVTESECQARGGSHCLYTVSWDAEEAAVAADPQQRVTALEAQLVAMSERLQSAYATASDLISTADMETVLRRIVERAASAVRTPSHILAVRTSPGAELQVYSVGMNEEHARKLALESLSRGSSVGDSTLAVEVSSSRRSYGQLIARYPGATEFLPQERELLVLYAKHAAAVLDMASALADAARRHEQVSLLLTLAHEVARAGTSREVAERLCVAVPQVVDCDRVGVWLWDELEQQLRCLEVSQRPDEETEYLRAVGVTPAASPSVARMVARPEPQFFGADTEDGFISQLMERLEICGLVVVPIVARDTFLGVLTVSVIHEPARLRSNEDLLQRMTGVAALAATAIQNGQLIDGLHHRADHDALSGLLNRVGLGHRVDEIFEDAGLRHDRLGLLFIDLDEFKQINDAYGHETGDEVIRKVATRLEAITRGSGDAIARIGGDEFVVILGDVADAAQLQAAEMRMRAAFADSFVLNDERITLSVSVGSALWPQHGETLDQLVGHADAAMYADKARHRAEPRPELFAPHDLPGQSSV